MQSFRRLATGARSTRPTRSLLPNGRPKNLNELRALSSLISRRLNPDAAATTSTFSNQQQQQQRRGVTIVRGNTLSQWGSGGMRPPTVPTRIVYVGNIPFDCDEDALIEYFTPFGTVSNAKIVRLPDGTSRGFAYVELPDVESASRAVERLHGSPFGGRQLAVQFVHAPDKVSRSFQRDSGVGQLASPPSNVLFLGNLPFDLSDGDLNQLFEDVEGCVNVRVSIDRRTGNTKGYAHADFVDVEAATRAKQMLEGTTIHDRIIRIDFSGGKTAQGQGQGQNQEQAGEDVKGLQDFVASVEQQQQHEQQGQ